MLRLSLMNSQPAPIASYSARVVFPGGMRAHAVREALPKLGKLYMGRILGDPAVRHARAARVRSRCEPSSASSRASAIGWLM